MSGSLSNPAPTLRALSDRFVREFRPRLRREFPSAELRRRAQQLYLAAWRSDVHHLYRIPRADGTLLADVPLWAFKSSDMERLRDQMMDGGLAGGTATRTLGAFSVFWAWWAAQAGYEGHSPCKGVERPRSAQRTEYLPKHEIPGLYERCRLYGPPVLFPMAMTALNTGMRKGEIFGLRRSCVHLTERRIDVQRSYAGPTKGGKPRSVAINWDLFPVLRDWLARCPPTPEDLVFPVPAFPQHHAYACPWSAWRGPWKMGTQQHMVGLPEMLPERPGGGAWAAPWHLLRHTFASHYVMQRGRASIYHLQQILGHADVKTTMRYAHLAPDFLAEGMEGLGLGLDSEPAETAPESESDRVAALRREVARLRQEIERVERERDRLGWRLRAAEAGDAARVCAAGWTAWDAWGEALVLELEKRDDDASQAVLSAYAALYDAGGSRPPAVRALSRYLGMGEMILGRWLARQGLPAPPRGCGGRRRWTDAELVALGGMRR